MIPKDELERLDTFLQASLCPKTPLSEQDMAYISIGGFIVVLPKEGGVLRYRLEKMDS